MAIPTFVNYSGAAGTGAVNPGLPSGIQNNDILILTIEGEGEDVSADAAPAGGAWTAIDGSTGSVASGTTGSSDKTRNTTYWTRYNSSSPPSTAVPDAGNHTLVVITAWRGCITSESPIHKYQSSSSGSNNTSISITGTTTTVDDCLIVLISTCGDNDGLTAYPGTQNHTSNWTNANLANPGITECVDVDTNTGSDGGIHIAYGGLATHGATGTTTAIHSLSEEEANWCIALMPPVGAQTYEGEITDGAKLGEITNRNIIISPSAADEIKLGEISVATKYTAPTSQTLYPATQETEIELYGEPYTEVILGQKEQLESGVSLHAPTVVSVPPLEIPPLLLAGIAFRNVAVTQISVTMEQTAQREAEVTLYEPTVITPPERVIREGIKFGDVLTGIEKPVLKEGIKLGDIVVGTVIEGAVSESVDVVDGIKFGDIIDGEIRERIECEITEGIKLGDIIIPTYRTKPFITDGIKTGETLSFTKTIRPRITEGIKLGELEYEDIVGSYVADLPEGVRLGDKIDGVLTLYSDIVEGIQTGDIVDVEQHIANEGNIVDGVKFGDIVATKEATQYTCTVLDGLVFGDNSLGVESGGDFIIDGEVYGSETTTPHEFTSITTGGINKFAQSTAAHNHGLGCYRALFYGASAIAYGQKDFIAVTDRYYRVYFYLPAGFSGTANQASNIVRLYDGNSVIVGFGVQTDGGGAAWRWAISLYGTAFSTKNFSLGAWHRVDIHWKAGTGANGGAQLWVDGDSIYSLFTLNHSSYAADNLRCGLVSTAFVPDNGEYMYFDDIKADSSFIGPYNRSVPYPRAEMTEYSSLLDGFKLGDIANRYLGELFSIADGVKFGEDKSVTLTIRTVTTDGVKIGENVDALAQFFSALTDGVKFGDMFTELTRKKVVITFDTEKATITFAAETPSITFDSDSVDMRFRVGVRGKMT
jgi:hypothetical protein